VKGITASVLPHGERITIEFSKEVAFTGDRVENPDRVFFDFANATAPASLLDRGPTPSGTLVKALRIGRHPNNVTRFVLELAGNPRYSAFPMYDPFRLVIDVESADAGAPTPTPTATPTPTPTPPPTTVVAPPPAMAMSAKPKEAAPAPPPPADRPAPARIGGTPVAGTPEPPSSNRTGEYSRVSWAWASRASSSTPGTAATIRVRKPTASTSPSSRSMSRSGSRSCSRRSRDLPSS
jgi:hypothetical protein